MRMNVKNIFVWVLTAALTLVITGCDGCGSGPTQPEPNVPTTPTGPTVSHGTFTDSRDGTVYKTVTINTQTWMAENLNYKTDYSKCYGKDSTNCDIYGSLYDWYDATEVCPAGWHLPTRDEWGKLAKVAGGTGTYGDSGTAGTKLKSKTGWLNNGNGTDDYGFSALPGGMGDSGDFFDGVGATSYWWTATENDNTTSYSVYFRGMRHYGENIYAGSGPTRREYYVRCVQD